MSAFPHQSSPPSIPFLIPHAAHQVGDLPHSSSSSHSIGDVLLQELLSCECISSFDNGNEVFYSSAMLDSPLPSLQAQLGGVSRSRQASMGKKRRDESCRTKSAGAKFCQGSNAKKKMRQNKCENGPQEAERKIISQCIEEKEPLEYPTEYIHVRARRGQATDSHSIAERVRREKISERMKLLQGLVPGCDQITGKAHMLDEIINYVQSLQNQVEFLSMKLASVNPILLEAGSDFDECMFQELASMPALAQFQEQTPSFRQITNEYTQLGDFSAFSLDEEGSTTLTQVYENGRFEMQLADHHHAFLDQT